MTRNIPGFLFISQVTSLGNVTLPIMFAMAMLAGSATRQAATAGAEVAPTPSRRHNERVYEPSSASGT